MLYWVLYILAAFTVKLSVIFFYRRIFVVPRFRNITLGLIILVSLWFVVFEATAFFVCLPFSAFQNRLEGNRWGGVNLCVFITGVFDALLDSVIVVLPIRTIWTLQVGKAQKAAIIFIFLLASM